MEVIKKDVRIESVRMRVDENIVIVRERRKAKIRVSDPICLG